VRFRTTLRGGAGQEKVTGAGWGGSQLLPHRPLALSRKPPARLLTLRRLGSGDLIESAQAHFTADIPQAPAVREPLPPCGRLYHASHSGPSGHQTDRRGAIQVLSVPYPAAGALPEGGTFSTDSTLGRQACSATCIAAMSSEISRHLNLLTSPESRFVGASFWEATDSSRSARGRFR
jgi:hypothetical protein